MATTWLTSYMYFFAVQESEGEDAEASRVTLAQDMGKVGTPGCTTAVGDG